MLIALVVLGCVVSFLGVWTVVQEKNLSSLKESNADLSSKINQLTKQLGEVQGNRWVHEDVYDLRLLTNIVQHLNRKLESLCTACEAQHGKLEIINKPSERIVRFAGRDA